MSGPNPAWHRGYDEGRAAAEQTDPKDAEIARLQAWVDRLIKMRSEDDEEYLKTIEGLRCHLEGARAALSLQAKNTLAFRDDWLREKDRADRLEPVTSEKGV